MGKKSRTAYMAKNFMWAIVGNLSNSLLGFISRTVFIHMIGTTYLGINGLFANVLGMLSLAELGMGSAISFSLYKPLAEGDTKKIQAIINFYRTAYRLIAAVVACVGLSLIPFLGYFVKDADGVEHIVLIYCIFLFNSVTSYLVVYKTILLDADQRNYLITNINTVVKCITVVLQLLVLVLTKNYFLYLITEAVIQLTSKIYLNYFTNKQYPYIKEKNNEKLSAEEKNVIFVKIKALILHKVGEVAIYQTDNIITSAVINVTVVGLVSNFTMIISMINKFAMSFLNSAVAGFGNVIATENPSQRFKIYKRYEFLAFYFFGWTGIGLYFLLEPFVSVWLGRNMLIDTVTMTLLCVNYYVTGMRVPLGNIKAAAGIQEQDRWVPLIQAAINIVVSIQAAKMWGLKGIYIGTLVSSMVPTLVRPYIVYKYVFEKGCRSYFIEYLKRISVLAVNIVIINIILGLIQISNPFISLLCKGIVCAVVPNIIIVASCYRRDEFQYVLDMVSKIAGKLKKTK